uniref:Agmatine deiminase n=1 Tax=Chlorobium chlorochromatii (strain CaD3) TaxID=340177 RepID=Q3AS22_CHLCH
MPTTYHMPPEWALHQATWLSWPHKLESWPGKFEPVPAVFAEIAAWLSTSEEVHINVLDEAMANEARRLISKVQGVPLRMERIVLHTIANNDAWCRDYGPNYVFHEKDGKRDKVIIKWKYNAWGGKYEPYDADDNVAFVIAAMQQIPLFETAMVLEGGSIDVNGEGLLLTTEACLLNPNRNPFLNKEQIEKILGCYLGVQKVLWLGDGIVGDDTDGHIDDLARFVNANTVVITVEDDPADENYPILQENYERLCTFTDLEGKPLNVVKLPMPSTVFYNNERLPATYANFYIANSVVLVPTYRCANDAKAIEILQRYFPTRQVIGIDCTDLIWGLGAIHCISHEEPVL